MLAIVAAGAMTMGLAMPTSVFAAEGDTTNTSAYISKTYNTAVKKAEKFSFVATQKTDGTGLVTDEAPIQIPDISFTDDNVGSTTKRVQISFPSYTKAGQYEYTVKEQDTAEPTVANSEHEKMIMSKAEYTVDVYVSDTDNGHLTISNIIVNKTKDDAGNDTTGKITDIGNTDTNAFRFTNTYVQEAGTGETPSTPGDDYSKYGSLNVSKTIKTDEADNVDTAKDFNFTATFNFPAGTDVTTLGGVKGNGMDITSEIKNGTYSFTLKTGKNMKFTGLPVGTEISVKESATPNYKGSATVVINGENQDTVTAAKYNEAITVSNKSLGQKKNTVDVTNTYNYVPTTGIIMNTLPYVLMIALCGAALMAFVAFKRRRLQK